MTWPPTMPEPPAARASWCESFIRTLGSGCPFEASTSNANVNNASPARIAVASSNFLWQVGSPRRRSSLSITGKSSCIREYVCTISMAAAKGSDHSSGTSKSSADFNTKNGRNRLPPAIVE